jgi:predicted ArsR family transcriptional regulator
MGAEFFHGLNVDDIRKYIESLSNTNTEILKYLAVVGMNEQEIADAVGLSKESVKFRLRLMAEQISPDGKTKAGIVASVWKSGYGRKWSDEVFGGMDLGDDKQC